MEGNILNFTIIRFTLSLIILQTIVSVLYHLSTLKSGSFQGPIFYSSNLLDFPQYLWPHAWNLEAGNYLQPIVSQNSMFSKLFERSNCISWGRGPPSIWATNFRRYQTSSAWTDNLPVLTPLIEFCTGGPGL